MELRPRSKESCSQKGWKTLTTLNTSMPAPARLLLVLLLWSSVARYRFAARVSASVGDASPTSGLAPSSHDDRPFYDIVVAVFVKGGNSTEALSEIALTRQVYARYGNSVVVPENDESALSHTNGSEVPASLDIPLSLKVVFIVGGEGLPEDVKVPNSGLLLGDFFHVHVREGYKHIAEKTRAMLGISEHLR